MPKGLATLAAAERLLSAVCAPVLPQVCQLRKAPPTLSTGMRSGACVAPLVPQQIGTVSKCTATVRAGVGALASMGTALVLAQVGALCVAAPALTTAVGALTSMH